MRAGDSRTGARRAYARAGVDLDEAARAVELIREIAAGAGRPEVIEGVGGFAGLVDLGDGRVLAAATDGVGTKVEVARMAGRLDTVGIDLVAMCANDVVCTGAEPLLFLDYLAVGRLVAEDAAAIVRGVAEGCRQAGCALLGGETAEHPGSLEAGRFDLAGFCVGIARREDLLGPSRVRAGDALIGFASSGLHSNGYGLVRRLLLEDHDLDDVLPEIGRPLVDELLEPTHIYVRTILELRARGLIASAAHITGGGLVENIARALPTGMGGVVHRSAWTVPAIFSLLAEKAGTTPMALSEVLNMGIGMVAVIPAASVDVVMEEATWGELAPMVLGKVSTSPGVAVV